MPLILGHGVILLYCTGIVSAAFSSVVVAPQAVKKFFSKNAKLVAANLSVCENLGVKLKF